MTGTKKSLITDLGFVDITENVLKNLGLKTTKTAKAVVNKINRTDGYKVYFNSDLNVFTIYSPLLVTQEERDQIKMLLKKEYKRDWMAHIDGTLLNRWMEESFISKED